MEHLMGPIVLATLKPLALLGLIALAACIVEEALPTGPADNGDPDPDRPWARMDIFPSSESVDAVGGRAEFFARIVDPRGYTIPGIPIIWSSEDPTIATIDSVGTAVALQAGIARLTATSGLVSATAEFTIDTVFTADACTSCHGYFPGEHAQWSAVSQTSCAACHRGRDAPVHGTSWRAHGVVAPFELLAPHDTLPCVGCHNVMTGAATTSQADLSVCYDCHADDYQTQHGGSGYPTDCVSCHTPDSWQGATPQNHDADYFPINSGKHAGRWSDCSTCHVNPNDFGTFSCFNCHEHNRQKMDDKHRNRSGYVYDSRACLSCHPDGQD